jgi:3-phenylpropionate/trans-cinnamate dioxygenase ferredoxin reductase subunit
MSRGTLVIGGNQAGVQIASSMREAGYDQPITIVTSERHLPYQRPPLSKAALRADTAVESLSFRSAEFYAEQSIDVVLGERVANLTTDESGAGVARSESGREFAFDQLALATGARARRLPIPGSDLDGVLYLRDFDDSLVLREQLGQVEEVLVIGGGFIGLEVAASARAMGREVTVVLADERLLQRSVGAAVSELFLRAHTRRGVTVHAGVSPTQLLDDGAGHVVGAWLDDGSTVSAQLVVVGIGAEPRTELAAQLGLEISNGIVIDERGVASDGTTVAAGDCVSCPVPGGAPGERARFESVSTAMEQSKVAGLTLAGHDATYRSVPWFWSDQFDLKLQVAGLSTHHDSFAVRGDIDAEKVTILYFQQGRLIAADCVNRPADFVAVRTALSSGRTIPAELVGDLDLPLKKLIVDQSPAEVVPAAAAEARS